MSVLRLECLCGYLSVTSEGCSHATRSEQKMRTDSTAASENRSPAKMGLAYHHAGEPRLCNSFRHASLKSRKGSIAGEFNIPRSSVSVLFGAKYVSTIILTTLSAFSMVCIFDRTRIRLIKAYTFTKSDISALLCP